MTFLIDTHYVLWTALGPGFLEPWAETVVGDVENTVFVSAASVYEIGIKVRLGKLPKAEVFERNILANIERLGFTVLGLSPEVTIRAARFTSEHRDPFDRFIAAQAIELDLELLTVDGEMDTFGVRRLKGPVAG